MWHYTRHHECPNWTVLCVRLPPGISNAALAGMRMRDRSDAGIYNPTHASMPSHPQVRPKVVARGGTKISKMVLIGKRMDDLGCSFFLRGTRNMQSESRSQSMWERIKYCRSNKGCTADRVSTALVLNTLHLSKPDVTCLQGRKDNTTFLLVRGA